MSLLLAVLVLGQFPSSITARQGSSLDGGRTAWAVDCVSGCSGSPSSSTVGVNILDAGAPLNINPPVSLPLPTGASTSSLQTTGNASLANLDVALSTRTKPADQQHVIIDTPTVAVSLATAPTTPVSGLDGGALATDTQVALIAAELVNGSQQVKVSNLPPVPARNPLTGAAKVDGSGAVQPVTAAALPLPGNAAQEDGGYLALIAGQLGALTNGQQATVVTYVQQPLNPFLLRCNAVRRTNCQP